MQIKSISIDWMQLEQSGREVGAGGDSELAGTSGHEWLDHSPATLDAAGTQVECFRGRICTSIVSSILLEYCTRVLHSSFYTRYVRELDRTEHAGRRR